jgi:hypothetical protein
VTVLVMVLFASRLASAQATLPAGGTVTFQFLKVENPEDNPNNDPNKFFQPDLDKRPDYFNLAHCTCAKAGKETFKYTVHSTMQQGTTHPLSFYAGTACDADITSRNTTCQQLSSLPAPFATPDIPIDNLYTSSPDIAFNLFSLVNVKKTGTADDCARREDTVQIWAMYSADGGITTFDFTLPQEVGSLASDSTTAIKGVDTLPPLALQNVSASPNENAVNISWTPPTSNNTEVQYFQALCMTADGQPVPGHGDTAHYVTALSTCGVANPKGDVVDPPTAVGDGETTVSLANTPADFQNLDSKYICATSSSSSANSLTIGGLTNETPYQVMLLAVDFHGNYSGTFLTSTVTPHEVTDFWEDLHDRGSNVQGGLCLLAETYGDDSGLTQGLRAFRDDSLAGSRAGRWLIRGYYATLGQFGGAVHGSLALRIVAGTLMFPAVALALAWNALTLPGLIIALAAGWWLYRRRRDVARWLTRRVRSRGLGFTSVTAIVAAAALYASPAHAGSGYQPYWETNDPIDDKNQALADAPGLVRWHVGIRVGPYIPDIDKQFGGTKPGPYEQMFGNNFRLLPMLDVDRIVWSGFGQVGVGLSIGYLSRNARAFEMGSDPADPMRPRDLNARNSFHLIPMALTATYRFTWFDDEYGVPLVPYVRGGLSYYAWWMKAPSGNFSVVCKDGSTDEDTCDRDKAYGASLGLQGSIGLAIRAERIDKSTAISMRASGIQHAGIYGELSIAKVDGFGSDSKLSVGDRTWFAGVDFEF